MSANFSNPTTSSTYTNFVTEVKDRDDDIVKGMDPAVVTPTNVPTNALRWNSVNKYWEKYNGTSWAAMSTDYAITITGSAAKWTTARTITLGTDLTGNVSLDGSANVTLNATLNTVTAAKGGTGQTTYAVGDLLYANTTTTLAKLADVATGNSLISGGVGVAPSWGKVGLTTHVSGTLAVGNGGTGATTLTGVVYGNGTGAMTAATGAQLSSAIGATYVQNANFATDAGTLDTLDSTAFVTRPVANGRNGAKGLVRAGDVDGSSDYSYMVRATWDGSRWLLRGYGPNADTTFHAAARVEFADAATSATSATTATTATNWGTYGGVPTAGSVPGVNGIPRADANGYTFFNYINSNTSASENPTIGQVIVTNNSDNAYYRKASIAHLTSAVQANASGSWGINITGSSASTTGASTSCSGNAATVTHNASRTDATAYPVVWMSGANSPAYSCASVTITSSTGQLTAGILYSNGNVTAYSDERVKTNWRSFGPDFIERLALVKSGTYDRTDTELTQVGVGAQSLQRVMPHAIQEGEDGKLSVAYGQAALAACVEMAKEIVALRERLAKLEA